MTDHFEVIHRDGTARVGRLRLSDPVTTPAIADDIVIDAGSRWAGDPPGPAPRADAVTILPHRGMPPGTPDQVLDAFAIAPANFEGPSGAVVTTRDATDHGTDLYALSTVQGLVGHARAFRDAIVTVRRAIPDDSALYCSGIATPANVGLLAYAGVDLVDTDRMHIAATQRRYHTTAGARRLDDLEELPCPCPACEEGVDGLDPDRLQDHNVRLLHSRLASVRERIRAGRLRGQVSATVRHTPWLTAAFRGFDDEAEYAARHAPMFRRARIEATTDDDIRRPEVARFMRRVRERYVARFDVPLVLLPCSATKPYSESQSHRQFRDAIAYRAHAVSLSSPLGVVPQELECTYPAQHYDVPVTGRWTATEREAIGDELAAYLRDRSYPHIIAHVPPGPYTEIVERAAAAAAVDPRYTVADHPTTAESLDALAEALDGRTPYRREERRANTVRALADVQFGHAAGDELFPGITVEAPYPKHRVLDDEGVHVATMVPEYGLLALTLDGARRWVRSDVTTRRVEIDAFVPHGDVLAPGIRDATADILVGDEVVVTGPAAFGVGRATMPGRAMVESTRGIAVDVRHVAER